MASFGIMANFPLPFSPRKTECFLWTTWFKKSHPQAQQALQSSMIFPESCTISVSIPAWCNSSNTVWIRKKGFGYVIALDRLINTTGDSNLCFRPLSPTLETELCIVWKKYQALSRASSAFLQLVRNLFYFLFFCFCICHIYFPFLCSPLWEYHTLFQ